MLKLILLILTVLLVYWMFFGTRSKIAPEDPPPTTKTSRKMVSCAYCHVHVPADEAIAGNGQNYCCDEHRRLDAS